MREGQWKEGKEEGEGRKEEKEEGEMEEEETRGEEEEGEGEEGKRRRKKNVLAQLKIRPAVLQSGCGQGCLGPFGSCYLKVGRLPLIVLKLPNTKIQLVFLR